MTECSAAMLLMKLSCSPFTSQNSHHHHQVNQYINFNSNGDFIVKTMREVKGGSRGLWPLKLAYPYIYNVNLGLSSIEINLLIEEDYSLLFLLVPEVPVVFV